MIWSITPTNILASDCDTYAPLHIKTIVIHSRYLTSNLTEADLLLSDFDKIWHYDSLRLVWWLRLRYIAFTSCRYPSLTSVAFLLFSVYRFLLIVRQLTDVHMHKGKLSSCQILAWSRKWSEWSETKNAYPICSGWGVDLWTSTG